MGGALATSVPVLYIFSFLLRLGRVGLCQVKKSTSGHMLRQNRNLYTQCDKTYTRTTFSKYIVSTIQLFWCLKFPHFLKIFFWPGLLISFFQEKIIPGKNPALNHIIIKCNAYNRKMLVTFSYKTEGRFWH